MIQKVIQIVKDANGGTKPALLYVPPALANTSNLPVLFFFQGIGESGSDLSKIYNSATAGGPAYFIEHGQWTDPYATQLVVISPQATSGSTTATELIYMIKWAISNLGIDPNRVYITGLSAGGGCVIEYITHYNQATGKPDLPIQIKVAAAVPMSAQMGNPSQQMINNIISDKVNVWGFGSMTDSLGIATRVLVQGAFGGNGGSVTGLNSLGRFTSYVGGHSGWMNFYTPTYTEVINGKPMNIYQWMLQFAQNAVVQQPPVVVQPPVDVPPPPAPKTIKSITITYSDNSQVTLP